MKTFERILRKISVWLGYFSSAFFAIVALLFVSSSFSTSFSDSNIWWLFPSGAIFFGLMAWLFFRSARKHKARDTWTDRIRAKNERNKKVMLKKKSCPHCGQRLDVCDQTPQLRINPIRMYSTCEYYCPACDERFNVSENYADYIVQERDIPQSDGEEFRVKPGTPIFTLAFILVFAFIGGIFLFAAVRGALSFPSAPATEVPVGINISALLLLFVLSLVFLGGAFFMFRSLKQVLGVFFRLLDDGIVHSDGITTRYYIWEDFRIAQYLPKAYMSKPGYAFDTKEHQFIILSNVKDYQRLCEVMMEKLRESGCRVLEER